MDEVEDSSLHYAGGFVLRRGWVMIPGIPNAEEFADEDFTRVSVLKDGQWLYFDLDMTVRSLCAVGDPPQAAYLLGRDGRISIRKPGGPAEEEIADAGTGKGKLGYVHAIREIGGTLYVCGVAGQVYRREKKGWAHFDQDVLDRNGGPRALSLYAIDGTSGSDIYAVGQRGLIWHHDGRGWSRPDSPTGLDLNWVRCASPDEVYLCGNAGTFYRGSREGWEDFSIPGLKDDLWCVELFEGRVYLAADDGLYVFDGKAVELVETGLDPEPDGYRLHANDGVLWSFGVDHLAYFDGKTWTQVKDPDNP